MHKLRNKSVLFLSILISLMISPAIAKKPDTLRIQINSHKFSFLYYTNHNVDSIRSGYSRAIIVVHGASRNAEDYYDRVYTPAEEAGHAEYISVIVAPNFITQSDLEDRNLPEDFLFWYSSGWKKGDLSRNTSSHPRPARISSFAIIDTIIIRLLENYPDLTRLIIVGHSAGGQFVNRYAAGNPLDTLIRNQYGIIPRYVVANPSSYLYLNGERRVEDSYTEFALPADPPCSDYNEYKYGLENLNTYMNISGAEGIRAQFMTRETVYLLGEEDNNPNHSSLDKTCPAMMQGNHRLERGLIYYNYLQHFYGDTILTFHTLRTIPGVGHSSSGIFSSQCGKYYLFDYGTCAPSSMDNSAIPLIPSLVEAYPNPFNNKITFKVTIRHEALISLEIVNIEGKQVQSLLDKKVLQSGNYEFHWINNSGSSGIYFYRLISDGIVSATGKVILLK